MRTLSQTLFSTALCAWVLLVPIVDLQVSALEIPLVLDCELPANAGCAAANGGCPDQMPEDCPLRLQCCVCLQFGSFAMNVTDEFSTLLPAPAGSIRAALLPVLQGRSLRPPVPPPQPV